MTTSNTLWNQIIGRRALFSRLSLPPHEDRVMELSPSGDYARFEKIGWEKLASDTIVELLEAAAPDLAAASNELGSVKADDFTPEEVADLPFNVDFKFTPEVLAEARKLVEA